VEVSIVVVTHNQHDLLRQCLRSVLVALERVDGECIVVDNASTDATPKVMEEEFPGVRYVRNTANVHYTRAVNQGMRAGRGDFYLLLNDDTELDPELLRTLLAFMHSHPQCGAVGPRFLAPGTREVQVSAQRLPTPFLEVMRLTGLAWYLRERAWARGLQLSYPEPLPTRRVGWSCGGALFVRASVMQALDYHDERYLFYCDETDLGRRLADAGWQVWYDADTWLLHHHGASTVKTDRRVRFELIAVRSRRHYYRKFFGVPGLLAVELADAGATTLRVLGALLRGRFSEARERAAQLPRLVEACWMPSEEREAIEGYRRAPYNGLEVSERD
jgi:GT2 family glycosyltransferase